MAISGTMTSADRVPMKDATVEIDIGGVDTWVAVETWANVVEPTRGTVPTSDEYNLNGDQFTSRGQQGTARVRVTCFFTEGATDPHANLYGLIGTAVDVRWSKSGTTGDKRFYTSGGYLVDCPPPGFNAQNNQSTMFTFEISCDDILSEDIPA